MGPQVTGLFGSGTKFIILDMDLQVTGLFGSGIKFLPGDHTKSLDSLAVHGTQTHFSAVLPFHVIQNSYINW